MCNKLAETSSRFREHALHMRIMIILVLLVFPSIADAPALVWRLVPVEWVEVNLCAEPCMYKARWVKRYEWRAESNSR